MRIEICVLVCSLPRLVDDLYWSVLALVLAWHTRRKAATAVAFLGRLLLRETRFVTVNVRPPALNLSPEYCTSQTG